jgi:hypothetical protein
MIFIGEYMIASKKVLSCAALCRETGLASNTLFESQSFVHSAAAALQLLHHFCFSS